VLYISGIFRDLDRFSRSLRSPRIFEMRHISAFGHRNDDVVPLACDEIIALECLAYSAGLDPDNWIVLRVE